MGAGGTLLFLPLPPSLAHHFSPCFFSLLLFFLLCSPQGGQRGEEHSVPRGDSYPAGSAGPLSPPFLKSSMQIWWSERPSAQKLEFARAGVSQSLALHPTPRSEAPGALPLFAESFALGKSLCPHSLWSPCFLPNTWEAGMAGTSPLLLPTHLAWEEL